MDSTVLSDDRAADNGLATAPHPDRPVVEPVKETPRYETLDALRGVAAIAVALFHGASIFGANLPAGYLAVDFFFMLSGFVMHHAYGRKLDRGMGATRFMTMRILRLYPVYALGTIVAVVLTILTHRFSAGLFGASVFGLTGLPFPPIAFGYVMYPANGPAWSLFYELLANLVMVLTWRFLTTRVLIIACLTGFTGLILCSFFYSGMDHGLRWTDIPMGVARVLFGFTCGLLAYRLTGRFRTPLWIGYALPVILVGLLAVPAPNRWTLDLLVVVLVFPVLLFLGGSVVSRTGVISRLWVILGLASYPLYMIHRPILRAVEAAFPDFGGPVAAVVILPALVLASYGVALLFDLPIQKLFKQWRPGWIAGFAPKAGERA
jgi:peptidoglycan/LPS O-acetylase OafA/YrhL